LSRKQQCPKGVCAKQTTFLESLEKIETPRKGQDTPDTKLLRQTAKALVEMNFFKGFS
jgi:hypothetical protein